MLNPLYNTSWGPLLLHYVPSKTTPRRGSASTTTARHHSPGSWWGSSVPAGSAFPAPAILPGLGAQWLLPLLWPPSLPELLCDSLALRSPGVCLPSPAGAFSLSTCSASLTASDNISFSFCCCSVVNGASFPLILTFHVHLTVLTKTTLFPCYRSN